MMIKFRRKNFYCSTGSGRQEVGRPKDGLTAETGPLLKVFPVELEQIDI